MISKDIKHKVTDSLIDIVIPKRAGIAPKVTTNNPQTQIDQQPEQHLTAELLGYVKSLEGVTLQPSRRAPPGTYGLYLDRELAVGQPDAFMLDNEFAHIHPEPDSSLHMTLPNSIRAAALENGWAIAHPMAGQPTVSQNLVMIFAPRDTNEAKTVMDLLYASWHFAAGHYS